MCEYYFFVPTKCKLIFCPNFLQIVRDVSPVFKFLDYRKSARTSRKIYPQNRICKVGGRLLCTDSEFPLEKS